MFNRYRELERASDGKRLDIVLMAAVSGLEDIAHPSRHDLKQFAELFTPLFGQAGPETRRTAVAALSRRPEMPADIVRLIASEAIDIAAPFLVNSTALDDTAIERIIETGSTPHIRALARRAHISPRIVAALMKTGDSVVLRSLGVRRLLPEDASSTVARYETEPSADDETERLRQKLRALVGRRQRMRMNDHAAFSLSEEMAGRLDRFAQRQEPLYFATALADALHTSFQLAERIMLDVSGIQLAETMTALGLEKQAAITALEAFFPHLRQLSGGRRLSSRILEGCERERARERLSLWLRADPVALSRKPVREPQPVSSRAGSNDGVSTGQLQTHFCPVIDHGAVKRRA